MSNFLAVFAVSTLAVAGYAFAKNPVDEAMEKYQADLTKFQTDLTNNKDKATLEADKERIKTDKSALKAARRTAAKKGYDY